MRAYAIGCRNYSALSLTYYIAGQHNQILTIPLPSFAASTGQSVSLSLSLPPSLSVSVSETHTILLLF